MTPPPPRLLSPALARHVTYMGSPPCMRASLHLLVVASGGGVRVLGVGTPYNCQHAVQLATVRLLPLPPPPPCPPPTPPTPMHDQRCYRVTSARGNRRQVRACAVCRPACQFVFCGVMTAVAVGSGTLIARPPLALLARPPSSSHTGVHMVVVCPRWAFVAGAHPSGQGLTPTGALRAHHVLAACSRLR